MSEKRLTAFRFLANFVGERKSAEIPASFERYEMKKFFAILIMVAVALGDVAMHAEERADAAIAVDGATIVESAMKYIGTPYRRGRMTPYKGFDCSGFTTYVFQTQNITLPRTSRAQYSSETAVSDTRNLKKGDLVFFSGSRVSKRIGHVGIVTDVEADGTFSFIHASCSAGVTVSSSTEAYYAKRYIGACRVLPDEPTLPPGLDVFPDIVKTRHAYRYFVTPAE